MSSSSAADKDEMEIEQVFDAVLPSSTRSKSSSSSSSSSASSSRGRRKQRPQEARIQPPPAAAAAAAVSQKPRFFEVLQWQDNSQRRVLEHVWITQAKSERHAYEKCQDLDMPMHGDLELTEIDLSKPTVVYYEIAELAPASDGGQQGDEDIENLNLFVRTNHSIQSSAAATNGRMEKRARLSSDATPDIPALVIAGNLEEAKKLLQYETEHLQQIGTKPVQVK